jgi:hypothetical protein
MRHRPIRTLSILGMLAAAVITLGVTLKRVSPPPAPAQRAIETLLTDALAALDAGDITTAREIAANLRLRGDIPALGLGIPPYVLGKAMHYDAEMERNEYERKPLYLLAARYLEEARRVGFPADRENDGLFLLGKSLHDCERYVEALPHLHALLERSPRNATQAYRLLSQCYLRGRTPDLIRASEFNELYLRDDALPRQESAFPPGGNPLSAGKIHGMPNGVGPIAPQFVDARGRHAAGGAAAIAGRGPDGQRIGSNR